MRFPRKSIVATCCGARSCVARAVRAPDGRAACAHLNRSYKNMIVPCAEVAFLLPPQQVYTAPHPPAGERGYPPWELCTHTHTHTRIYAYDVIRTVSHLIVVTYLRRILYSGANYGCVSIVAERAVDDQHTTVSSVFMRYISAIYTVHTRI